MFGTTSKKPKTSSEIIFTPKDYQSESIKFLLKYVEAGLFLATGLGKTVIFLCAFYILKRKGIVNNALVIAKRRIIHNVWPKENHKWGFDFKIVKVVGTASQRLKALAEPADIHLMTYQNIDWLSRIAEGPVANRPNKDLLKQWDWLCLDESSMVKNWNAARSKRLRRLLPYFSRRTIMTASPIPRSMMDIFSQMYCLDMGDALGKLKGIFKNRYWEKVVNESESGSGRTWVTWELDEESEARIYEDIKELLIRFPKDVVKLPPLHKFERVLQLPPEARQIYRELEETHVAETKGGTVIAANAGVALQKLRQISGGAIYNTSFEYSDGNEKHRRSDFTVIHDEKIEELGELIEELQGEPLLVAYEFDHERQRIQAAFPGIPAIGGGTSDAEADILIDQWNAGELPVLLGHPDSIAHGLNLQESGWNICFFSIGWNLENHMQFIDRVYRQGQDHAVWVYLLVCEDTADEAVIANLYIKDMNQERLFRAIETHIHRRQDMHEWKKVKLPGKLPTAKKVIEIFIEELGEAIMPWWEESLEFPDFTFGSTLMVSLGGWLPHRHASFLSKVFGKKVNEDQPIFELFKQTQKAIFTSLKMDTVDAEAPIVSRGKGRSSFGSARIYVSKDPSFTKSVWPIVHNRKEENDMATSKFSNGKDGKDAKAPAKKKAAAKKAPAKKAPAKKAAVTRTAMDGKAKVTKGKNSPSGKGIHAQLAKLVGKGVTVDALCKAAASKLEHDRAKEAGFVQGYIRGGVRRGYLNLAEK